jgi:hypothetical protein
MSGQFDTKNEQNGTACALVQIRDEDADAADAPDKPGQGPGNARPATEIGFLAQLIACRHGFSAYRRHRREEPAVASRRYRAGAEAADTPVRQPRTVRLV